MDDAQEERLARWQREMAAEMDRQSQMLGEVLMTVKRQDGRVATLEQWRDEHTDWSTATVGGIEQRIAAIATGVGPQIESIIERVLDSRQTTADAAAYRALVAQYGDPAEGLGRWAALTRLLSSAASRVWLTLATGAAADCGDAGRLARPGDVAGDAAWRAGAVLRAAAGRVGRRGRRAAAADRRHAHRHDGWDGSLRAGPAGPEPAAPAEHHRPRHGGALSADARGQRRAAEMTGVTDAGPR